MKLHVALFGISLSATPCISCKQLKYTENNVLCRLRQDEKLNILAEKFLFSGFCTAYEKIVYRKLT